MLQSPGARRWLQVLTVGLVLFFFGLALYSQREEILSYRWELDPLLFGLALVLLVLRGPAVVYGMWSSQRLLGYKLPFMTCMRIGYHSALARYLPGQFWYAVSRVYLAEKQGVPPVVTTVSLGIETAMVVFGAVIVASLSLGVWRDAPVWVGALVLVPLAAAIARPQLFVGLLNWGLGRIGRKTIELRLSSADMLRLLFPFVLNWLHYGLMSFVMTAALYPALEWRQAPAVGGLFTAAWLVGFLAIIVPQGLVIREGLVFTFLTTLIGVPAPVATAAAILSRIFTMAGEAFWAAVSARF